MVNDESTVSKENYLGLLKQAEIENEKLSLELKKINGVVEHFDGGENR